jgi:hypothetical protein
MRKANPNTSCSAIKDEFEQHAGFWMEPGSSWILALLAVSGIILFVGACVGLATAVRWWLTPG